MGKCPYCTAELHIEDFFHMSTKETKKGKLKKTIEGFKGESLFVRKWESKKMWVCPSCDTILGFSESAWSPNII